MNIQQSTKIGIVIALLGIATSPAQANTCGDISPLKSALGDKYLSIDYSPESDARNSDLNDDDLIELIEASSLRSGKGVRYRCLGTGDAERAVATEFTLENISRIETASGNVQIHAWEESERKKASAVFDIPKAAIWQSNSENAYTTSLIFRRTQYNHLLESPINPNSQRPRYIHDTNLFPKALIPAGSQHAELTQTIQTSHNTITLTETLYVNGHKTDWVTWNLDR